MTANVSTVTVKGQVTIPKAVRRALDIRENDQLLFLVEGGRAVLIPLRPRPLQELYGALPATRPFPGHDAIRAELRAELGPDTAEGGA